MDKPETLVTFRDTGNIGHYTGRRQTRDTGNIGHYTGRRQTRDTGNI